MYDQVPKIGRINLAFIDLQDEKYQSEKTWMGQPAPQPYYPNAGYQVPRGNPDPCGYPNQPYRAPRGPQKPYTQQPLPGMPAYPQAVYVGHKGVNVQPTVVVIEKPMVNPVPDYLCYSIFTLLCCCLPLGIAAVIYSCYTRSAKMAGQREVAKRSSKLALILNNVALAIGLTAIVVSIIIEYAIP